MKLFLRTHRHPPGASRILPDGSSPSFVERAWDLLAHPGYVGAHRKRGRKEKPSALCVIIVMV
jgi:hypothetical protein